MRGSTQHVHPGHARLRCHGTDANSRLGSRPLVEASRHDRRSEILTLRQGQGSEMASLLARNAAVPVAMDGERRSPPPSRAAGHNSGAPAAAAPHYDDHCSPLRERVLKAGIESLPDYELLELLFTHGSAACGSPRIADEISSVRSARSTPPAARAGSTTAPCGRRRCAGPARSARPTPRCRGRAGHLSRTVSDFLVVGRAAPTIQMTAPRAQLSALASLVAISRRHLVGRQRIVRLAIALAVLLDSSCIGGLTARDSARLQSRLSGDAVANIAQTPETAHLSNSNGEASA